MFAKKIVRASLLALAMIISPLAHADVGAAGQDPVAAQVTRATGSESLTQEERKAAQHALQETRQLGKKFRDKINKD